MTTIYYKKFYESAYKFINKINFLIIFNYIICVVNIFLFNVSHPLSPRTGIYINLRFQRSPKAISLSLSKKLSKDLHAAWLSEIDTWTKEKTMTQNFNGTDHLINDLFPYGIITFHYIKIFIKNSFFFLSLHTFFLTF